MVIVEQIGAVAGIIAFIGMALLALLYFSQGRDVRRLREWAGRAPERPVGVPEAYSSEAAERARPKRPRMRLPRQPRYIAVLVGGVLVFGAALSFAVLQVTGGDRETSANKAKGKKKPRPEKVASVQPSQVTVAVLNGTSTPGLASTIGSSLVAAGFKIGNVTNAGETDVVTTKVLYSKGSKAEARAVARQLKVPSRRIEAIDKANRDLAGGADVAVVAGKDRADDAQPQPQQQPAPAPSAGGAPETGAVPQQ